MTRRNRLFSTLALGLSLAAGLAVAAPTASAQTSTHMTARIPFAFSVNDKPMPAGTYSIDVRKDGFLFLNNLDTRDTRIVQVWSDSSSPNQGTSRLTFRRQAGQSYLSQIWVVGQARHVELAFHPKPQRELAKSDVPETIYEISTK